jgi:aspartyl-tRNA(Asn)/glutamyl-tRNA(Gln) amidotransferase subunit A
MTDATETLIDLDRRLRDGGTTAAAETEACLARIAERDGDLGAYQAVYDDAAREAARAADSARRSGGRLGPLHGEPFALKDIVDLEDMVTTWGSEALADRIAPATGTLARRLLAAGAVLLGKTKTVECAFGGWGTNRRMGTPRNPWDGAVHRAPGGSSSGSGVAVAAGMARFAVGTDTGGSVRIPAAFCGIVGLKVTEGRLPLDGIMPLSHTLDTPGPMTRSVADAAVVFAVMDGAEGATLDRELAASDGLFAALDRGVEGLRLGVLDESERAAVAPEILALYDAALDALERRGARLAPFTAPTSFAELSDRTGRIIAAEGFAHQGALYRDRSAPMDEDVRERMLAGAGIGAADHLALIVDRPRQRERFLAEMRGLDAVLTPTAPVAPPPVGEIDQSTSPGRYTRPVNYLGLCALSVPMGLTPEGLPGGLQIVARPNAEATALQVGAALETAVAHGAGPAAYQS